MSLARRTEHLFAPSTRGRGEAYFRRGAVSLHERSPQHAVAVVEGDDDYVVEVRHGNGILYLGCSCPYFETAPDPCKHVWAGILAAEDAGALLGINGDRLAVVLQPPKDRPQLERRPKKVTPAPAPGWKTELEMLSRRMSAGRSETATAWPKDRKIYYVVNGLRSTHSSDLVVEVWTRDRRQNGDWGKMKPFRCPLEHVSQLPDPRDREAVILLNGGIDRSSFYSFRGRSADAAYHEYVLIDPSPRMLLPSLCATDRCYLSLDAIDLDEASPVSWDGGDPWQLWLVVREDDTRLTLLSELRRGEERRPFSDALLAHGSGLVWFKDTVALLDHGGGNYWLNWLQSNRALGVPREQGEELARELFRLPRQIRIELPPSLRFETRQPVAKPIVRIHAPGKDRLSPFSEPRLQASLSFDYDGHQVAFGAPGPSLLIENERLLIQRDIALELRAEETLRGLGCRTGQSLRDKLPVLELLPRNLQRLVNDLVGRGWRVEADGRVYRAHGLAKLKVRSGVDWFDLSGRVEFDGASASLPALLRAIRDGESTIVLDDGTVGLLPEDWLKKYGALAGFGDTQEESLRFAQNQVGLLDALLAAQEEVDLDERFERARAELQNFEGVRALEPPRGFVGELRPYQKEGLGWMTFLRDFAFGGCLADDMGLGKTVMVLAILEARREERVRLASRGGAGESGESATSRAPIGPSLVVVPRSLIFNWKAEARRFTPFLQILDHTGTGRAPIPENLEEIDIVLTTYGTLRRDALRFKEIAFDYVILDEAQAIKNSDTESAKVTRLLRGSHKLALSGTPIENHLGELWSLFEFLNPGMLGNNAAATRILRDAGARNQIGEKRAASTEARQLLAKALRPYILRRTKEQVARDLPPRLEQTIFCEMGTKQRALYDELRTHYQASLLHAVSKQGIAKSKMQILEALLRLRQAACHPGLLDAKRKTDASAKLDLIVPQLADVIEEGHKALVFSQFTSLLAILRERLDAEGIPYEYLDGRTRDREARVTKFQEDPDTKLFLVSLKAGGVGLNLTAAEYVFLLDPWWNPAVEAQAIDRAHRIGQTRTVFAYRLIARGTVEEKILELQQSKRSLADAVITADNSLIRDLGREELELLLS